MQNTEQLLLISPLHVTFSFRSHNLRCSSRNGEKKTIALQHTFKKKDEETSLRITLALLSEKKKNVFSFSSSHSERLRTCLGRLDNKIARRPTE